MPKSKQDDVGKAEAAVRRGINRLIALLGSCNPTTLREAAMALDRLGAAAIVGPLTAALPRAKETGHRLAITGTLITYAPERRAQVVEALAGAARRERDPYISATMKAALAHVMAAEVVSSMLHHAAVHGDSSA